MKSKSILALIAVFIMAFMAFSFLSTPSTPTLYSPSNGASFKTTTPTLDWSDITPAPTCEMVYRLQVSTDQNFNTVNMDHNISSTSQYTVLSGELSAGSTYYWRVNASNSGRSCNDPGTSSWSDVWHFTIEN